MTKNEALKAAIDGKKVGPVLRHNKLEYLTIDGANFVHKFIGQNQIEHHANDPWGMFERWEIVPEYVDFLQHGKRMKQGKQFKANLVRNGKMANMNIHGKFLFQTFVANG